MEDEGETLDAEVEELELSMTTLRKQENKNFNLW
jgi:hypothetical protein